MNLLIKPKLHSLICNIIYYPCSITCSSLLDATSRILAFVFIAVNVTLSNFNFHVPPHFSFHFFIRNSSHSLLQSPFLFVGESVKRFLLTLDSGNPSCSKTSRRDFMWPFCRTLSGFIGSTKFQCE